MLALTLLTLLLPITILATKPERKATFTPGTNSSLSLTSRSLLHLNPRQYTCADAGYGLCDAGQCCPLDGACCGTFACATAGEACCGNDGYVYPLDGSECCSDGSHCDPGASCYECVDYPGSVCCYAPGDVEDYEEGVGDAYASYSAAVESVNAQNSAEWSSYTAAVAGAVSSYDAAWSSYDAAWSSYDVAYSSYTVGGYDYQYYYSTYYYYIIIWYTTTLSTVELTSSSSSTSTVLSAYCTNSAEASLSWSQLAQSVESQVSYSAAQSSQAATYGVASGTATYSGPVAGGGSGGGGVGGGSNGAGSMRMAGEGLLAVVLPMLGLMVGVFAVVL